jgi:hypothetical protein
MKKFICLSIVILSLVKNGSSQTVQGTLLAGSASNKVIFALKASSNFSAPFTNVQFVLQIPNTVSPIPTVSISNNFLAGFIPSYNNSTVNNTTPIAFSNDGTYYDYLFSAAPTGQPAFSFTTVTTPVLEVQITGAQGVAAVRFANLPNGGASGQHYFYIEANGLDYTNQSNMFYGAGSSNSASGYAGYSFVPLSNVSLPVQFTSFNVQCNDKGAILSWGTAMEQNSDRFEIQRSTNSTDWVVIDNVTAAGFSTNLRNYQYLDLKSGSAFYRIRQVDKNGNSVYSSIKQTDCKVSQFTVLLYPVPARDNLNVVINSDQALKTDLQIIDINGRTVKRISTQIVKGNNNILLNVSELPGGQYLLTSTDPSIIINKKFTVIR